MSGVVDVGDPFKLTFESIAGALVTVDWLDPDLVPVLNAEIVPPAGPDSTQYPRTLVPTRAGMWTARFTDSAGASEAYYVRARSIAGVRPPLAAIGDVEEQYGTLTDDESELTGYLLKAASAMVRQTFPNTDAYMAEGRLDPDVVALQVANMALRVLRNPEGLRSETTGPFSRAYDTAAAAGLLVFTDDERDGLTPTPAAQSKPAGWTPASTIRVVPGLAPAVPARTWLGGDRFGPW